jgi:hypothetical protein
MAEGERQIAATMETGQDQTAKSNKIIASTIQVALDRIGQLSAGQDQLSAGLDGIASAQDDMLQTVQNIDQKADLVLEDTDKIVATQGKLHGTMFYYTSKCCFTGCI